MTGFPKPRLEHLFDMHIDLETPQAIGAAPAGHRQIYIVTGGTVIPPRTLAVGSPARVKRDLTEAELQQVRFAGPHYVEFAKRFRNGWRKI